MRSSSDGHGLRALCALVTATVTARSCRQTLAFFGFALFAGDALAWGLQTHVFLAQAALLALPAVALCDPELRRAALRLPRLVLTGACLPDLALMGRLLATP